MRSDGVLIISAHPLFAEAITHILQKEGIAVSARADSLESALARLKEYRPGAIIFDRGSEAGLSDAEALSLLSQSGGDCQIILITLADNRMIVHHRQQVVDATPDDLIAVLRGSFGGVDAGVGP